MSLAPVETFKKYFKLFIYLLILLSLVSCNLTRNDDDVQRARISDILHRVRDGFNSRDINSIMSFYHDDFLHQGFTVRTQQSIWLERFEYNMLEVEIIGIDIRDEYAVARMRLRFHDGRGITEVWAPEMLGDMSYFYHERGEWLIHGNRER